VRRAPGTREHAWSGGVCLRCFMRLHWEGAKHGCEGHMTVEEHRVRNRRHVQRKKARAKMTKPMIADAVVGIIHQNDSMPALTFDVVRNQERGRP